MLVLACSFLLFLQQLLGVLLLQLLLSVPDALVLVLFGEDGQEGAREQHHHEPVVHDEEDHAVDGDEDLVRLVVQILDALDVLGVGRLYRVLDRVDEAARHRNELLGVATLRAHVRQSQPEGTQKEIDERGRDRGEPVVEGRPDVVENGHLGHEEKRDLQHAKYHGQYVHESLIVVIHSQPVVQDWKLRVILCQVFF